jgi:acetone carboxylase alpha subunit
MADSPTSLATLSQEEQSLLQKFVDDHTLFYGPDEAIMRDHGFAPRTPLEDRILSGSIDLHALHLVRGRLLAALDETYDMVEQMGAAPGAKWGDLVTAVYTASGDLSEISPKGVVVFSAVCHYPLKFIIKYWTDDPTVGVHDGDGFIHNDSRYGNIHNTDQSMILPVFHDGRLLCWVSSTIHEGENGACEPGGMPSAAETPFDEGLKMSPFRIVENFQIRRDLLTFLQNSVRDPKLQYEDIKVKLTACLRLRDRVLAVIAEYGEDALVATLRKTIEDVEAEVRARIADLPDGTYRCHAFIDGSLRELGIAKLAFAVTVRGDKMVLDARGSAPQFVNRSVNSTLASFKTCLATSFLQYIWPDLPHSMAFFAPIEVLTDRNSMIDCGYDVPNAMSLTPLFKTFSLVQYVMPKLLYSTPTRYSSIVAPWFNQPHTFIYGGVTQHREVTGNFCADINGNGGGARADRDGEHAMSPIFGFMCDTGEQELAEEELPMVRIVAQKLSTDRVGFGKYRGGLGYEQIVSVRDSDAWGFMTGGTGSKISSACGLFGGYGSPAYPLLKIKDVDVFAVMEQHPEQLEFDMLRLMNERPIPGATYSTQHMGTTFELCKPGEIYMISQGSGGGYGDVLERDPELVMRDLREGLISHETAWDIYRVVYDHALLFVDAAATARARQEERQARKRRGVPFKAFTAQWTRTEPPTGIPYYGAWDDTGTIWSGVGPNRRTFPARQITGTILPNPKDVRIAELEAENAALRAALAQRG